MGRFTQVVYPSLGIRFIAIQEHVDTLTGDGMEMMSFHNIFNEWYAAQTVRKIFALCLAGKGPMQIARQLEEEQILSPAAYFESIGRKHAQKVLKKPCGWEQATVDYILENRQYTGCAVNFKSTTVSYKVHKRIQHSEEDYQIIPNMQEAIISEEQWLRVQELRKHKRRPTKTGRTSLFSGLLYCYDCKSKMHLCTISAILSLNSLCWKRSATYPILYAVMSRYSCICWQRKTMPCGRNNTNSFSRRLKTAQSG